MYSTDDRRVPFWWHGPEVLERILNNETISLGMSTDVYMLGCTLMEMCHDSKFVPFQDMDSMQGTTLRVSL